MSWFEGRWNICRWKGENDVINFKQREWNQKLTLSRNVRKNSNVSAKSTNITFCWKETQAILSKKKKKCMTKIVGEEDNYNFQMLILKSHFHQVTAFKMLPLPKRALKDEAASDLALAGSAGPIISCHRWTAFSPTSSNASTGPVLMKLSWALGNMRQETAWTKTVHICLWKPCNCFIIHAWKLQAMQSL